MNLFSSSRVMDASQTNKPTATKSSTKTNTTSSDHLKRRRSSISSNQSYHPSAHRRTAPLHHKHGSSPDSPPTPVFMDRQNAQRKRQRRQAGAALVAGMFAGGKDSGGASNVTPTQSATGATSKKKSTAQPRPDINVPPRGIGPIYEPNENDVLCGRGGRINAHQGNVRFREIVVVRKKDYLSPLTKKLAKAHIAADIVRGIRAKDPPGRFLKEDPDGSWFDIGDAKAIKKVGQCLREDAPDIRQEIGSDEEEGRDGSGANASAPAKKGTEVTADKKKVKPPASTSSTAHKVPTSIPTPIATVSIHPATAVSGRGGKVISSNRSVGSAQSGSSFHPMPYQGAPEPYQIVPPEEIIKEQQQHSTRKGIFPGMRHIIPKAAVSGAAAAVIRQEQDNSYGVYPPPPTQDIAFGRSFHNPDNANESSMISGLSGPNTQISGMSGISALTDPISSISAEQGRSTSGGGAFAPPAARPQSAQQFQSMRMQQLQQLRNQWAVSKGSLNTNSQRTFTSADLRSIGSIRSGLSMARSMSWKEGQQHYPDHMSWAEHSLVGGGIQDGASVMSGYHSFHSYYMRNADDSNSFAQMAAMAASHYPPHHHPVPAPAPLAPSVFRSPAQQGYYPQTAQAVVARASQHPLGPAANPYHSSGTGNMGAPPMHSGASVASMSLNSESLGNQSIMSELSETLVALDLAEPKLLDQFEM